jgi:hypothetical protein
VPEDVAAQITYLVGAELEKVSAEASLHTGTGRPKAAALPRAPPPEVLEIEDESSGKDERAPRHVPKVKRHGKAKQAPPEWLELLDTRGERVICPEGRGGTTLESGWKLIKYFPDRATARLWLLAKQVSDSDSSSASSSESEESSSSSSSTSTFLAPPSAKARRSQRPKKKKKKKKKKKRERKGDSSYRGTDCSTGDEKRMHGFEVSGVAIDKALVPAGLASKDRVFLVETAVDVAALPGMFLATHSQAYDEVQGVTEAATQCWLHSPASVLSSTTRSGRLGASILWGL